MLIRIITNSHIFLQPQRKLLNWLYSGELLFKKIVQSYVTYHCHCMAANAFARPLWPVCREGSFSCHTYVTSDLMRRTTPLKFALNIMQGVLIEDLFEPGAAREASKCIKYIREIVQGWSCLWGLSSGWKWMHFLFYFTTMKQWTFHNLMLYCSGLMYTTISNCREGLWVCICLGSRRFAPIYSPPGPVPRPFDSVPVCSGNPLEHHW